MCCHPFEAAVPCDRAPEHGARWSKEPSGLEFIMWTHPLGQQQRWGKGDQDMLFLLRDMARVWFLQGKPFQAEIPHLCPGTTNTSLLSLKISPPSSLLVLL